MSDTKTRCLDSGAKLAAEVGVVNVTRSAIAKEVGVSAVMVGKVLGTTEDRNTAIKKHMRKLKLKEPSKAEQLAKGVELRKRGPRAPRQPVAKPTKARKFATAKAPAQATT